MNKLNLNLINTLMMLYQKAIEYYSAMESPHFEIYLNKLKDLLTR